MKVLFLARSTLHTVYGGDTVQIQSTAKYLRKLGVEVDLKLANEKIDYADYDLLHVFNAIRPADSLAHVRRSGKPYVLSTIYVDFSEYQLAHATGITALLSRLLGRDQMEFAKVIGRRLKNGHRIHSPEYIFLGHRKAVQKLAQGAAMLLPNSQNEYKRFSAAYGVQKPYKVVYNGLDMEVFRLPEKTAPTAHDSNKVICVARIEGNKNQLNLIRALNGTGFQLKLVGRPAPNHIQYYEACRQLAGPNVRFADFIPQEELVKHYREAKVHILPSWNETCGLSSLEAAYAGCNIVITDKGDTKEYFGEDAWYCQPDDLSSIYEAVAAAAMAPLSTKLREAVQTTFNWQQAAKSTLEAYNAVLNANGRRP